MNETIDLCVAVFALTLATGILDAIVRGADEEKGRYAPTGSFLAFAICVLLTYVSLAALIATFAGYDHWWDKPLFYPIFIVTAVILRFAMLAVSEPLQTFFWEPGRAKRVRRV